MEFVKICRLLLASTLFLAACDKKSEPKNAASPLVVGVSVDNRPWEYYKDGKPVGFDIDLVNTIGERLGRPIVIKDMSFDGLLGALQSNSIDMTISAMTPTEDRRKAVDMTQKYHEAKTELVCLKTSPVQSLQDLKGLTVGAQQGSTHEQFARQELEGALNIQIKALSKVPELLQELKIGRISCLIIGRSEAQSIAEEMPEVKVIPVERNVPGGEAIALPKGSEWTAKVDTIITQLKQDGTLKALGAKWLKE
jgi:ABC-type amino acid transport substrate-binding protein